MVRFSAKGDQSDALDRGIVEDYNVRGEAAPSLTIIDGRAAIRSAIVNHRTTIEDLDAFVAALNRRGAASATPRRHFRFRGQQNPGTGLPAV